jgi:DMSO/TMAO reductase YedYZ molybdopterin-dependent catalytic subunit
MPSTTITATLTSSGHPEENGVFQFTGITLWSILQHAAIQDSASLVTVKASDGFTAYFMVSEIKNSQQILLAYLQDGQPLKTAADGGDGPVRLVVGSDVYASRWVKYVTTIQVT